MVHLTMMAGPLKILCSTNLSSCANKVHLRELLKLNVAGNIGGDRCKSY